MMPLNKKLTFIRDIPSQRIRKPSAATIGNFDGLHLGHYSVIKKLVVNAKENDLVPTVITFEPSPYVFFQPNSKTMRLSSLAEKIHLLKQWGVSQILCLRFNQSLATLSAEDFIDKICHALNLKYLIIGEDFRFGHKQSGNCALLQEIAKTKNFTVETLSLKQENASKISSTVIRENIVANQWNKVSSLLGRHFSLTRRVIRGQRKGHILGFPTANIPLRASEEDIKGVYITRVWVDNQPYWAASNAGTRPSVGGKRHLFESHLFDFSEELYGKRITVEIFHKIRDEIRFDSLDALRKQISMDVQYAKEWIINIKKVNNDSFS